MFGIPFPFLSFFVVYVVMTLIFSTNQSPCASFLKSMVTLFLSFKRVTNARNLLIEVITTNVTRRTIHSLSHFTLTTTQLKPLFLKTSNYSKTIQRLVLSFRNLHSFIQMRQKHTIGNFLARSSFQINDQPSNFICAHARCKTCPFIQNANKIIIRTSAIH